MKWRDLWKWEPWRFQNCLLLFLMHPVYILLTRSIDRDGKNVNCFDAYIIIILDLIFVIFISLGFGEFYQCSDRWAISHQISSVCNSYSLSYRSMRCPYLRSFIVSYQRLEIYSTYACDFHFPSTVVFSKVCWSHYL